MASGAQGLLACWGVGANERAFVSLQGMPMKSAAAALD